MLSSECEYEGTHHTCRVFARHLQDWALHSTSLHLVFYEVRSNNNRH